MKKFLKILGFIVLGIVLILAILYFIFNESRPDGVEGEKAEALAKKIEAAVDKAAWDTTQYIQWTFRGEHSFLWDKERHLVKVNWGDNEVLLNPNEVSGIATVAGKAQDEKANDKLVKTACHYFWNDSFWMNAFTKFYDKGVSRGIVKTDDGREGLMVTYSSGGITPGDSYLWFTDENGLPTSWKMWVNIIPIGGLEFTWENWEKLPSGAMVAKDHKSKILEIPLTNVKAGNSYTDFGLTEDPFNAINN